MTPEKRISLWLFICCGLVFAMTVIGAITRLTESGLSMVEWRPLIGALPPLNEAEWQRVFAIYQDTPEYQLKNFWMGIEDFKTIFFWEWFHRLWGRLIGLVYALPLIWFAATKQIPKGFGWPLFGFLILGGMQGVMGWYMVESGLVDRPSVSHFRLAAHLSLALIIFSVLFWTGYTLWRGPDQPRHPMPLALKSAGWVMAVFIAVTIVWGAFVAGLDGGLVYNSWPLMGEKMIPPEFAGSPPWWVDIVQTIPAVQFAHRWLGTTTGLLVLGYASLRLSRGGCKWLCLALAGMAIAQTGLGIATLLTQVWIPLAALHQAGAVILIMLTCLALHPLTPDRSTIR